MAQLSIQTQGGHLCPEGEYRFSPGDVVRGVVSMKLIQPLNVVSFTVTFLGEQQSKIENQMNPSSFVTVPLFRAPRELQRGGFLDFGTYTWPFAFRFPELPHDTDALRLQSRYPATFLFKSSGNAASMITRYVISARLSGVGLVDQVVDKALMFWPTRRFKIDSEPLNQPVTSQPAYYDISQGKTRFKVLTKSTRVGLLATLHTPRQHIIGDALSLQLDLHIRERAKPTDGDELPPCSILAVTIALHAVTTVGGHTQRVLQQKDVIIHLVHVKDIDKPIPVAFAHEAQDLSKRINIHDLLASEDWTTKVEPWKGMGAHPNDPLFGDHPITNGPVVPSFHAPLCRRRYYIRAAITIASAGKKQTLNVKSEDILFLPDKLDATSDVEPVQIPEIGQSTEIGRYEAPEAGLVEAGGRPLVGELDAYSRKPAELQASPNQVFELDAGPVAPRFLN